ncbi:MAG: sugar phosphate isomerase/epimerase [Kiritimatiellae bacterium]|jgi:sugar phosphate isomerase/epimerase|nr:sugar phosphate isomerase/epimerase [Kiritimatiellia bacterium]
MKRECSRRQVLSGVAQAAVLCGMGGSSSSVQAASGTPKAGLKIGVSTLGFGGFSNAALAKELSGAGVGVIQLFLSQTDSKFWKYNGRSDLSSLTPARCREIAAVYRDAGIDIHSIGVYTNLIHPDEGEIKANLAYFESMMEIGGHMGVRTFINEAGHYHDSEAPAPRIELAFQDEVWPRMVTTGRKMAAMADKHDAKILLEPFYRGFLTSAKRVRLFVEEVNSPRVRVLLDPANLIELNDLDEMFQQLAPLVDCLHAKDRKLHIERGVAAGKGDLDYQRFVTLAARQTPEAPMILEYVGADDYLAARAHLRQAMQKAGVTEIV